MSWTTAEAFWGRDTLYGKVGLHHFLPMLDEAACADLDDPDMFFPSQPVTDKKMASAMMVCRGCPVQNDCLDFALRNNIKYGVWGGTSGKQREALRRLA